MRSLRELIQHVRASRLGSSGRIEASAVRGSDLLARLPIELHIMLLEYISAEDVVAALSASKTLQIAWLSEDVWPWLADRWYPDLSQAVRAEAAQRYAIVRTLDSSTGDQLRGEYQSRSAKQGPQPAAPEASELFRQILGKLSRRNGGRYGSALHHKMQLLLDPVFLLSRSVPLDQGGITSTNDLDEDLLESATSPANVSRFMIYSNGRIAWWPNSYFTPYFAVVDDLRTTKRKMYQFPNHEGVQRGYKTAMSNELLVIARHTTIHAWHLEKDRLGSISVPEQFERCIAEGTNVLIITKYAEVWLWRFEGQLQRISMSNLGCYQHGLVRMGGLVDAPVQSSSIMAHIPRRQGLHLKDNGMMLDFILHPSLRDVFFIVTMHEGELIVHELDQGGLVKSYPLHTPTRTTVEEWKGINQYLRWEKCDSYGGYCLFSVYLDVEDELSPSSLQSPESPFCTCGQTTGLVSVCFNVYTKVFRVKCHHFLHSESLQAAPVPAAFHLWHDTLYTSYVPSNMRTGMPITALRSCLAVQEQQDEVPDSRIPVYTLSERSQGHLTRRHKSFPEGLANLPESRVQQLNWRRQVDFGLDTTARFAPSSVRSRVNTLWNWDKPHVHQTQTIVGDEDFLVYVVDGVYTAWSFGNEIPGPKVAVKWTPWNKT